MTDQLTETPVNCDVTLGPGDDLASALADLTEGAVVGLKPGTYRAGLRIQQSLTLRGLGASDQVRLDADGSGSCVTVADDDIDLRVEGLTLTGGNAEGGGAVTLVAMARVTLVDCLIHGNRARQVPGGAVYLDLGKLTLRRCHLFDNAADDAPAICADGIATLVLEDSLATAEIGPDDAVIRVRDGALATLRRSTIVAMTPEGASRSGAALHASGTTSRKPEVSIMECVLDGAEAIDAPPPFGSTVQAARSVLSTAPATPIEDLGGTVIGDPNLDPSGVPQIDSPALGIAQGAGTSDVHGRARPDRAAAGAIQPSRSSS